MSLRWKLALAMALVSSVATIAFGIASYRSTESRLIAEVDRSLLTLESPTSDDDDALPQRGGFPSQFDLQILDRSGRVLQTTRTEALEVSQEGQLVTGRPRETRFDTASVGGEEFRVLTLGSDFGAYQFVRSLGETNRILQGLRTRTVLISISVVTLSAALGWLVANQVTKPLRKLTSLTEQIAETGEVDVQIGVGGSDEVGRLSVGFDKMTDALARSRSEQQRLVQDAGHELRTPLTSLRTNIDMLRRYPNLDDEQRREILDDLHAETSELTTLMNEVVAIASGELDDEDLAVFDPRDVVDDVVQRFQRRFGDRSITMVVEGEATIRAQRSAVGRAVSCLVENACKFDPDHGPIQVRVSAGTIEVLDRGPGIEEGTVDRLFERFYRADASRSLPGSGLGLAMVQEIVDRNGGTVTAANRDGGGAVFTLRLPVAEHLPPPPAP